MRHFALPALTAGLLAAAGVHAAAPASVIVTGQRASLARAIAARSPHMVTAWPLRSSRIEQTVAIAPSPRMVMRSPAMPGF